MRRTGSTTLTVEVDEVEVDVVIEYELDIDNNYGADADGNRGVRRVECEVIGKYIDTMPDPPITTAQGEEAMRLAEEKFLREWGDHVS